MVTLDDFCSYARIDVQDDSATLEALIASSEQYVIGATGKARPPTGDKLYDIAVMMLAAHWYDNRTPTGSDTREIPYTLTLRLHHIALCSQYPEVSTDEPDQ